MSHIILVVEDFPAVRKVIVHTLQRQGYAVIEAEDGRDAVKHLNGQQIDLVITDYNMPVLDGPGFIKVLREKEQYKYLPVLVLSTETNPEKIEKAQEAQITGWIKKPFDTEKFLKVIKKALR